MEPVLHVLLHCLSVVTILACCIQKVPQIAHIYEKKSAVGFNLTASLMQLVSYTVTSLYNYLSGYSLLAYLEYPILLGQEMITVLLVLQYSQRLNIQSTRFSILCYWLVVIAFLVRVLPSSILTFVLPLCAPVSGASKCMYMHSIIQAESAETISLVTWAISICTNLSRMLTVYMDSVDFCLLFNLIVSTLLSVGVFLTANYYKTKSAATPHQD